MQHRTFSIIIVGLCLLVAAYLVNNGRSVLSAIRELRLRTPLSPIGATPIRLELMAELTDCWTYGTAGGFCAQKTVHTVQQPGESLDDFQDRHDALVAAQMKRYPPKEDS